MIIKSISDKRLIITVTVNNKDCNMLVDTGASIGIIDIEEKDTYKFKLRGKLGGTISGMGGESSNPAYYIKDCDINIQGLPVYLMIATNIDSVKNSIENETGIIINGIIGLTQIKMLEMKIDAENGIIKLGY